MDKKQRFAIVAFVLIAFMGIFSMYMVGKGTECAPIKEVTKDQDGNEIESYKDQDCTKYLLVGWFGLAFVLGVIFFLWWTNREKEKIPFNFIKQKYIKSMEELEKISINPLARTWQVTEEGSRYVFVLRDFIDDIAHYYMCEADMYTGAFGRGFGQYTTKQVDAYYWYQTRKKIDVQATINKELQNQLSRDVALRSRRQLAALEGLEGKEREFN